MQVTILSQSVHDWTATFADVMGSRLPRSGYVDDLHSLLSDHTEQLTLEEHIGGHGVVLI